tara:strand:- start:68 stop:832 length:765 start_codon:yes stop_codon:yes gene_type:complete
MLSKRPFILLVNDDGILASGLKFLATILKEDADVLVIAPDKEQSGKSHAISVDQKVKVKKVKELKGYAEYTCSGTPADCVKIAIHEILTKKPDLCVSGINHGANFSISTLYSGTLHAAMEGTIQGVPSISISHENYSHNIDFSGYNNFIKNIVNHILNVGLKGGVTLNINIPNIPYSKIKGIKLCNQGQGNWEEEYKKKGNFYYWLTGNFISFDNSKSSDIWAIKNNFISIVPVKTDMTDYKYLEEIKDLNIDV